MEVWSILSLFSNLLTSWQLFSVVHLAVLRCCLRKYVTLELFALNFVQVCRFWHCFISISYRWNIRTIQHFHYLADMNTCLYLVLSWCVSVVIPLTVYMWIIYDYAWKPFVQYGMQGVCFLIRSCWLCELI